MVQGCLGLNKRSLAAQENYFVESLCYLVFYFLQLLNTSFPVMHMGLYCRHQTKNEVHTSTALVHEWSSQGSALCRDGLLKAPRGLGGACFPLKRTGKDPEQTQPSPNTPQGQASAARRFQIC